jgi:Domain of unknown function (DUF4389)
LPGGLDSKPAGCHHRPVSETAAAEFPGAHPISLRITDDLRRTRLTVFFRLLLAVPHFVWEALLGILAILAVIVNWFATLFTGRSADALHSFLAGYLRYATHVSAYLFLLADPYPGFFLVNLKQDYPIDVEVAGPEPQGRASVFFRIILGIPAMIVANILRNLSSVLAFFSWWIALFTGRVPEGIRNFGAFALRYETQTYAYLALLTGRYPSFNVDITA